MCKDVFDVCFAKGEKMIIFCDNPFPQYTCELVFDTIGEPAYSIRALHSPSDRGATIAKFSDPKDPVKDLFANSKTGAVPINIQHACHRVLIMEMPTSFNLLMQIIGRRWRMGQSEAVQVKVLVTDHTYDQMLQHRATKKIMAQLAGTANLNIDTEEVKEAMDDPDALSDTDEYKDDYCRTRAKLKNDRTSKMITEMFGQHASRHWPEWGNSRDPRAKDHAPGEVKHGRFRNKKKSAVQTTLNLMPTPASAAL
ncbi:uncharacterized protein K452DRAFT_307557 [Aplosporella prunicola CBS 121167]|uniref:Helicase C-terminal domain-containing protein n=1 Tax=Aplosporella prunicola CBS 121167 TaxID=1176127 RepID=A0A6A6BH07_9PEZI|nr:uncharacterized protein K452DRAFT_307557 [Aplosporella prunicola CBS 121167]KAF2143429.1 hypothetical protein K452DRAFT_307557 [Aplosporella prunicola CBS 121167]